MIFTKIWKPDWDLTRNIEDIVGIALWQLGIFEGLNNDTMIVDHENWGVEHQHVGRIPPMALWNQIPSFWEYLVYIFSVTSFNTRESFNKDLAGDISPTNQARRRISVAFEKKKSGQLIKHRVKRQGLQGSISHIWGSVLSTKSMVKWSADRNGFCLCWFYDWVVDLH